MSMLSAPGLLLPKDQCRHDAALSLIDEAEPGIRPTTYTLNLVGRQFFDRHAHIVTIEPAPHNGELSILLPMIFSTINDR
jgi:hypothetical protein